MESRRIQGLTAAARVARLVGLIVICASATAVPALAGGGATAPPATSSGGAQGTASNGTRGAGTGPVATSEAPKAPTRSRLRRRILDVARKLGRTAGVLVVDDAGDTIAALRPRLALVPASNVKLFTTAALLERYGADFRLRTRALTATTPDDQGVVAGDLYLVGDGDPSLSTQRRARLWYPRAATVEALAAAVRAAGVRRIDGDIVGDETLFDSRRGGPGSRWRTSPWVGPISALIVDRGLAGDGRSYVVSPARAAAAALRAALRRAGVRVIGRSTSGRAPRTAGEIASISSMTIAELVRIVNRDSDNLFAEVLLKRLATSVRRPGTTATGAATVRALLRPLGVRPRIVDGSGLSRANRADAAMIVRLLRKAGARSWGAAWLRSLPLAGREGTLAWRLRSGPARGRCRAKTGTLSGVAALSGYCRARSGARYWFSLLANGVAVPRARALQDAIVQAIAGS